MPGEEVRTQAEVAELTASGTSVPERTLHRMRLKWRDEGAWDLVETAGHAAVHAQHGTSG
ncbi:hypothetical protein ABT063_32690 [Streptomyces sp. NPDC002838]|uniref:hypothetical protein n=1 Tax=Streptomyces sp. NPDC002838 TaxID=3154436 RepID=UPI003326C0C4